MAPDRDLEVAFVRAWAPGAHRSLEGWDMLAASGVRGLRVLHETDAFHGLLLTEANPAAAELLASNAARFPGARVEARDARAPSEGRFDLVDLDPYGTPVPFLEAALAAVRPGGTLAVTATDMMVLAGVQPGAAERRYGGRPVRGRLGPEGGLRLLLATVARAADARRLRVRPLLAYSHDHYVRAYLEVRPAPDAGGPGPIGPLGGAGYDGPPLGSDGVFGPMWLGPLLDADVVGRLLPPPGAADPPGTARWIARLKEEVAADVPFYYEANSLARALGLTHPPPIEFFLSALRGAGFRAARTQARPEGFRTDAPRAVVEATALRGSDQSQNARVRA